MNVKLKMIFYDFIVLLYNSMTNPNSQVSPKTFIDAISKCNLTQSPITIAAIGDRPEIYLNLFPCLVDCHVYYQGRDEFGRATSCDETNILFIDSGKTISDSDIDAPYILTVRGEKIDVTNADPNKGSLNTVRNFIEQAQVSFF